MRIRSRLPFIFTVALAAAGCAGMKQAVQTAMTPSSRQFISAAEEGRLDAVNQWLDKGIDVNIQPGDLLSRTALMVASANKRTQVVYDLLSHGADAKLKDNAGRTALHFAAEADSAEIIHQLAARSELDAVDHDGRTALLLAAQKGNAAAVGALLDAGASASIAGPNAVTPLHAAVDAVSAPVVRLLLLKNADKTVKNSYGDTPLDLAKRRDDHDLLALFAMNKKQLNAWTASSVMPAVTETAAPVAAADFSDVETPPKKRSERKDDYAFIVGIDDYQSVPKADYGVRDARTVRRYLEALGVPARNIVSLEGPAATSSKLKSYLEEWLPLNVKDDSTLFVYYSGHGAPDTATGEAYLVPWDADPQFLKSTAYPLKSFYASLAKTKAKRVLVALDACFSGAGGRSVLPKGARPLVTRADSAKPDDTRLTILAAASADEITGTVDGPKHGLFTYYLLKGLSGEAKNPDGAVTPVSLYAYLKPLVSDEARRRNRSQTPALIGAENDEPLAGR
jgi:hypothetical protein